jgi:hypothetical protein
MTGYFYAFWIDGFLMSASFFFAKTDNHVESQELNLAETGIMCRSYFWPSRLLPRCHQIPHPNHALRRGFSFSSLTRAPLFPAACLWKCDEVETIIDACRYCGLRLRPRNQRDWRVSMWIISTGVCKGRQHRLRGSRVMLVMLSNMAHPSR